MLSVLSLLILIFISFPLPLFIAFSSFLCVHFLPLLLFFVVLCRSNISILFKLLLGKQEVDLHLLLRALEHIDLVDRDHLVNLLGHVLVIDDEEDTHFVRAFLTVWNGLDAHLSGIEIVQESHHLCPVLSAIKLGILLGLEKMDFEMEWSLFLFDNIAEELWVVLIVKTVV